MRPVCSYLNLWLLLLVPTLSSCVGTKGWLPKFMGSHLELTTPEDTTLKGTLPNENGLKFIFAVVTQPTLGTLVLNPETGDFTYTPAQNKNGTDFFEYSVTRDSLTVSKKVYIQVEPVNNAPVAGAPTQRVTLAEDTPMGLVLQATDGDGDPLTFALTTPNHGTISGTPPNVTYTPAKDYNGPDSFSFTVSDGKVTSNTATVVLNITPVNDPPVAVAPQIVTLAEDTSVDIPLGASDVDADPLTYQLTGPSHGSLMGTAPNLVYQPDENYNGPDSFSFTVSDGKATSNTATVVLNITPVNDPPALTTSSFLVADDQPVVDRLAAIDPEGSPVTFQIETLPENGELTLLSADGDFRYTPYARLDPAEGDGFTVKISDGTDWVVETVSLVTQIQVAGQ